MLNYVTPQLEPVNHLTILQVRNVCCRVILVFAQSLPKIEEYQSGSNIPLKMGPHSEIETSFFTETETNFFCAKGIHLATLKREMVSSLFSS